MAAFSNWSLLVWPALLAAAAPIGEEPLTVSNVLQRALEAADASEFSRAYLHGIPSALARAGDVRAALNVVERMSPEANERERIAIAQAKAKDRAGAIRIANSIASDIGRGRALAQIAGVEAERGDTPAALEIVKQIKNPGAITWAQALIATAQAKAGYIDAALETVQSIPDALADSKVDVLTEIALAQARNASIEEAIKTAAGIKTDVHRITLLARLAEFLADHGRMDEGKAVLQKALAVERPARNESYGSALEKMATAQMKLGDRQTARKSFQEALELTNDKNLRVVVWAQAKAGDIEGALQNARAGRMGGQIGGGLELIATVQAESGDLKAALASAESIESVEVRSTALAKVAAAQRKSGMPAEAAGTFQKALVTAQTDLGDPRQQVRRRALYTIAYEQAKSGDEKSAYIWAMNEKDKYIQSRALLGIAEGMLARQEATAITNTGSSKGSDTRAEGRGD
jgi:tetratricopeptide (TPR) repeat protein